MQKNHPNFSYDQYGANWGAGNFSDEHFNFLQNQAPEVFRQTFGKRRYIRLANFKIITADVRELALRARTNLENREDIVKMREEANAEHKANEDRLNSGEIGESNLPKFMYYLRWYRMIINLERRAPETYKF